jgi:CrcB protein
MNWLLVAVGAALGAPARYLTDRAVQRRWGSGFPFGTLTVNLLGSLALGVLVGSADHGGASPDLLLLAGTGFCGAFTTYSTFSYETLRLAEDGRVGAATVNAVGAVLPGLAAAALGVAIGAHAFA